MRKHSSSFRNRRCGPLATVLVRPARSRRFKSPEEAADALVAALRAGDVKALVTVLGPGGDEIVSSGDRWRTPKRAELRGGL